MNLYKLLLLIILISSCGAKDMGEPTQKKIPFELIKHNVIRVDNYYWLRND